MRTIPYDNPQGRTDAQAVVTAALTNGRGVLIVGGKPGFCGKAHEHPLVSQWSSVGPKSSDREVRKIPSAVAVVLLTKFISWDLNHAVVQAAKAQGIDVVTKLQSPGSVRRLIMNDETEEEDMSTRVPVPPPAPRKALVAERESLESVRNAQIVSRDAAEKINQIAKLRDEAYAAIDLLFEAASEAIRKADTSSDAEKKLAALRSALL